MEINTNNVFGENMDFNVIKENLEKYGYDVSCFESVKEANQY